MKILFIVGLMFFSQLVAANSVKVVDVKLSHKDGQHYRVAVTLLHEDSGWDHYADGWQVLNADKKVIGERILHHPHENEQPFTRSLSDVVINKSEKCIYIRAHDKVHGNSELYKVNLN